VHVSLRTVTATTTLTGDFSAIRSYAPSHRPARLTFWSVDHDHARGSGGDGDSCGGLCPAPYASTKIFTRYAGVRSAR
jgi:hypothetical protein